MALIKCSECGKEISNKAAACPNCGSPITTEKIRVHFERKKGIMNISAVSGSLLVDGVVVGAVGNSTNFDVMLSPGLHSIVIENRTPGLRASGHTSSASLDIPENAKSVQVILKPKSDAMSMLIGSGMKFVVDEIIINK